MTYTMFMLLGRLQPVLLCCRACLTTSLRILHTWSFTLTRGQWLLTLVYGWEVELSSFRKDVEGAGLLVENPIRTPKPDPANIESQAL